MKTINGHGLKYIPASHEDPENPGSLKKVLIKKDDVEPGRMQMVNWSRLPSGKSFRGHFHENMDEIFVMIKGEVKIKAGYQEKILKRGDAVIIFAREVHTMYNNTQEEALYIAIGIASGTGGKTVVTDDF